MACGGSVDGPARRPEIQWWHAMGGQLGETLNALADGFNKSQNDYKVVAGLQGLLHRDPDRRDRRLPRQAGAPHRAGLRGRHRHHDGRQGRGLSRASADGRRQRAVRSQGLSAAVYGYYSTTDGKLLSMPFNSSTPVLYWNKERSRRPASIPTSRRRPGRSWARCARSWSPPAPVRLHAPVADLDA